MSKRYNRFLRNAASNLLTLMIVGLLAAMVAIGVVRASYTQAGSHEAPVIVTIESGMGINVIAARLADEGVIDSPLIYRLNARWEAAAPRHGEYEIPANASMAEITALLESGRSIQYPISIPEGLTSWEVVQVLNAQDILTGDIDAIPAEGSLAPDTYFVDRDTPRQLVIQRMQQAQESILAAAWDARADGLPLASAEEALILASIIEKETGVPSERRQVASVFINRMNQGMRLQTDPTVIYGITLGEGPLGRGLRRSELQAETPYNTYVIPGLPPTPIANPGRASIEAALNPDETPYIFFVADGTGGHAFAVTLEEHNANVARWREIERQQ